MPGLASRLCIEIQPVFQRDRRILTGYEIMALLQIVGGDKLIIPFC